jgi:hypothetical protein
VPSRHDVRECMVTADSILKREKPLLVIDESKHKTA